MVFGITRNSSRSWRSTGDLESLHNEPEDQVSVAEIEADRAAQLERVREMDCNEGLEPIPEVSAAIQLTSACQQRQSARNHRDSGRFLFR